MPPALRTAVIERARTPAGEKVLSRGIDRMASNNIETTTASARGPIHCISIR